MSYVYRSQECKEIERECNERRDPCLLFHHITLQPLTQTTLFTSLMSRPNRGPHFPEPTPQSLLPNPSPSSFTPKSYSFSYTTTLLILISSFFFLISLVQFVEFGFVNKLTFREIHQLSFFFPSYY